MTGDAHGDVLARGVTHDHAVNVVAGGPPAWLRTALRAALDRDAGTYPDERAAVAALAARHGRTPDEVVPLNGAVQAFALLPALAPRRPVIVHPQFTEPDRALPHARHVVLAPPWHLTADAIPPEADLVVVGRPTNPTGVAPAAATIRALRRPGRTVVVDEAFLPFTTAPSLADGPDLDGLVVVRSITKHLAIPGLRAGYLTAPAALAARLRAARPAWSVNALALAALAADAGRGPDPELPPRTRAARTALATALATIPGVTVHDGAANFLLLTVPDGPTTVERLRTEHELAIRPAWTFPGLTEQHVRVAVRGGAADARLVAALRAVVPPVRSGRARS